MIRYGTSANAQQLSAMGHVVDEYCRRAGIVPGTPQSQKVAGLVLALYGVGVREEKDLLKALNGPSRRLPERS